MRNDPRRSARGKCHRLRKNRPEPPEPIRHDNRNAFRVLPSEKPSEADQGVKGVVLRLQEGQPMNDRQDYRSHDLEVFCTILDVKAKRFFTIPT